MHNILVIDDSALVRKFMCDIINAHKDFSSTPAGADDVNAYKNILAGKYECVVLNITMQMQAGLKLLEKLASDQNNTPVVAIGSSIREDREISLKAMELGAVDYVIRPIKFKGNEKDDFISHLYSALDTAIKGIKKPKMTSSVGTKSASRTNKRDYDLIAIASSTGGPQALVRLVKGLSKKIDVPIIIVQHMPKGFTASLADRMDAYCKLKVKEAEDQERLQPGVVYLAPGGKHLKVVEKIKGIRTLEVYDGAPVNNLKPCADVMYKSLSNCSFEHILCIVLTGMGSDGCQGIKHLRKTKNLYVMTQNEESCVVYGMPKAIFESGESDETVHIDVMAQSISKELGV